MLYVSKSECWLLQTPEYQHFNKEKMHADAYVMCIIIYNTLNNPSHIGYYSNV